MVTLALSVLIAGFVGSLHCIGMCGPFVALASRPTTLGTAGRRAVAWRALVDYQLGRGLAYAVLGALAGTAGWMLDLGGHGLGWGHVAARIAAISMIAAGGLGLLGRPASRWPGVSVLVVGLTRALGGLHGRAPGAFGLGALTALLPCGWLHTFTITALGAGSGWAGAGVLLAFWLGTLPALVAASWLARNVLPRLGARVPVIMYTLAIAVGVFTWATRGQAPMSGRSPSCHGAP